MPAARLRLLIAASVAVAALGTASVPVGADDGIAGVEPAPSLPAGVSAVDSPVSILGPSRLDAAALVSVYLRVGHTARITVPLPELAQIFIEEGERYGVRADIAWAQSMLETLWLTYPDYGQVHPADNNYSGIGAYDHGPTGFAYPDARSGVRAQMQLLRQYADPAGPASIHDELLVHAPRSKWGIAPTWMQMGNGNWATSPTYAQKVTSIYFQMSGVAQVVMARPDPGPVQRPGDGMWIAGLDGHVYDVGDARFWGSAGGQVTTTIVAGIAMTPTRLGYWLVTSDGHVAPYGDAEEWGSADDVFAPVSDLVGAPDGSGYWVISERGEVRAFGAADRIDGPVDALPPGERVVAAASTPNGDGLWLAGEHGHVYTAGAAWSLGDATAFANVLDPVVDIASRPQGDGYWIVTASGGVHQFGGAPGYGSLRDEADGGVVPSSDLTIAPPRAVSVLPTLTGEGYWIVRSDGRVAGRGDAVDFPDVKLAGAPLVAASGWVDSGI